MDRDRLCRAFWPEGTSARHYRLARCLPEMIEAEPNLEVLAPATLHVVASSGADEEV